jgi:hypothetical protein
MDEGNRRRFLNFVSELATNSIVTFMMRGLTAAGSPIRRQVFAMQQPTKISCLLSIVSLLKIELFHAMRQVYSPRKRTHRQLSYPEESTVAPNAIWLCAFGVLVSGFGFQVVPSPTTTNQETSKTLAEFPRRLRTNSQNELGGIKGRCSDSGCAGFQSACIVVVTGDGKQPGSAWLLPLASLATLTLIAFTSHRP